MKFFALICLFSFPIASYCLTCQVGYTISIPSLAITTTVANTNTCPSDGNTYACFRADAMFTFGVTPGTGSIYFCAENPSSSCSVQCNNPLAAIGMVPGVNTAALSLLSFTIDSCAEVCCDTNNCNNVAVTEVANPLFPVATSTATTTTVTSGSSCSLPSIGLMLSLVLLVANVLAKFM